MALLGRMGRLNSKSKKALICTPKMMALKFRMYGILLRPKSSVVDEEGRVRFRNWHSVSVDVQRVQGCMKDLRTQGYCGVATKYQKACYTTERYHQQVTTGTLGQKNLARLNQIALEIGI